jgi:hypothetical protein
LLRFDAKQSSTNKKTRSATPRLLVGKKYKNSNGKSVIDIFPIDRGSFVQTGAHEVMLWTQGNVLLSN